MNGSPMLEELCRRCGIDLEYYDIWGKQHHAPAETQRALLAAMGIDTDNEADIRAALHEVEQRPWRRWLPEVSVARQHEAERFSLRVPAQLTRESFRWRLVLEDGGEHEGACVPAELPAVERHEAGDQVYVRVEVEFPVRPPLGYHRVEVSTAEGCRCEMALICVPDRAYEPEAIAAEGRVWGLTLQLYSVRSRRNWGMGDFSDLAALAEFAVARGAGVIGINPLHALFPDRPAHASPYGPSNRCFVNILYLDAEAMREFGECEEAQAQLSDPAFQARLRALRASEYVDYVEVAAAKRPILELLYRHFRERHLSSRSAHGRAFRRFMESGGERLRRHALFEALQEHFYKQDESVWSWPVWPAEYRDPRSEVVERFAAERHDRVEFFAWLQWQADLQLGAAAERGAELGLAIGLYKDLAVGADRGGAECWSEPGLFAPGASVGAPPDEFNLEGQDWGLPPMIPQRLRAAAYQPFIAMLQANMRHAGALRIDHVMGLMRLFWVPPGGTAEHGAYVNYPFRDLLGIVALESRRNRCLVIGEDLGTVPDEVRGALSEVGILSCRPFYFQRDYHTGSFEPPERYPRHALVSVGTHDLPTLSGFWRGHDLDLRSQLSLFPSEAAREQQIVSRSEARARILMVLESQGLLPEGQSVHPVGHPDMTPELSRAIHTFLARTPSQLMAIQPEDMLLQLEQMNLPGSTEDQYPNWRRKLPLALEDWGGDANVSAILDAVRAVRGSHNRERRGAPRRQGAVIPRATYRLQLTRDFTFDDATAIVPYLAALGISHCYVSPILKARPGSQHGYDIIDHNTLNPELGAPEAFESLVKTARAHGLGLMVDIVPNHMGVMGADNGWWLDVLEDGQASPYARFFDIDWEPLKEELRGKVLLPILGDQYGRVLESGALELRFDEERGEFSVCYYQHRLPIDPREYPAILRHGIDRLARRLDTGDPVLAEFEALSASFAHLPPRDGAAAEQVAERQRDKEVHKRHLAALCQRSPDIALFLRENVKEFNGAPGTPSSFDALHEVIKRQAWRVAYWRVASDEINYRRFFDINDLAGLRMEDEAVFEATHRFLFDLIERGKIDALRIDHPDGLYDPGAYFERLQKRLGELRAEGSKGNFPIYLVIEKILAEHERLPSNWPVHGTTGYRFTNVVNGLFVDTSAADKLSRIYADFTGQDLAFDELLYECKSLIMRVALASELNVLANRLSRIALASRYTCDFTVNSLRQALSEVVACFPVYRTYVTAEGVSEQDRRYIDWAVAVAKRRSTGADVSVFDFIRDVMTLEIGRDRSEDYRGAVAAFAMKLQQFTAPVMAKGMEDTAFYRYNRLASLNEVGGDPRTFGMTLNAFHGANQDRARHWPYTLLATSTHDTKRGEDVRARIDLLSENPAEWKLALWRWSRMNRSKKHEVDGIGPSPTANDEYLLYQILIGAWPLENPRGEALDAFRERIEEYMLKAARESKQHTSWINPNESYEKALVEFIRSLLAPSDRNMFLADFLAVIPASARFALYTSLSMTLVKLTTPGVPDFYQGNEVWDFSLVDPDNRRPVDFGRRNRFLEDAVALARMPAAERTGRLREMLANPEDGSLKLYLVHTVLALRAERESLFRSGDYLPLSASGYRSEHVCAYARRGDGLAIAVVGRFFSKLCRESGIPPTGEGIWSDTRIALPDGKATTFVDVLTGETIRGERSGEEHWVPVGRLLSTLPVALIVPA